jgi:hypothetical protein
MNLQNQIKFRVQPITLIAALSMTGSAWFPGLVLNLSSEIRLLLRWQGFQHLLHHLSSDTRCFGRLSQSDLRIPGKVRNLHI